MTQASVTDIQTQWVKPRTVLGSNLRHPVPLQPLGRRTADRVIAITYITVYCINSIYSKITLSYQAVVVDVVVFVV